MPSGDRIAWWDRLRIVAFVDIAGFHLHQVHALWGIGLPVFLLLATILPSLRYRTYDTRRFVGVRIERILVPWAFWACVLFVYVLAIGWRHDRPLGDLLSYRMLVVGPMEHMWFIPFIFVTGIVAHFVNVLTRRAPTIAFVAACSAVGVAVTLWNPMRSLRHPLEQWAFAAPAIPLGLAIGRILATAPGRAERRNHLLLYALALGAAALLMGTLGGGSIDLDTTRRYGLSILAILGCLYLPDWNEGFSAAFRDMSVAMYILHVPVEQQVVYRIEDLAGRQLPLLPAALLAGALTLGLILLLRRTRLRRFT